MARRRKRRGGLGSSTSTHRSKSAGLTGEAFRVMDRAATLMGRTRQDCGLSLSTLDRAGTQLARASAHAVSSLIRDEDSVATFRDIDQGNTRLGVLRRKWRRGCKVSPKG